MKTLKNVFLLLFFLVINIILYPSFYFVKNNAKAMVFNEQKIELIIKNNQEIFNYSFFILDENSSNIKRNFFKKYNNSEIIKKLEKEGFSNEEIVNYFNIKIKDIYHLINKKYHKESVDDIVEIVDNSCKIKLINGTYGLFVNKLKFYEKILHYLKLNKNKIFIDLDIESIDFEKINKSQISKKSEFFTCFSTSTEERKNNIKLALSRFDGIVLEAGECLSFNERTGIRNEKTGYLPAKIISGGTFIEGFGGGVCQVSTTLYNACLLAGLDIIEVHNHSLPVSYVEPSFDAMVNMGSSDLIIKNNTAEKIIITTSSKNDICKVAIFGKENEFFIKRVSEKEKEILAPNEKIIETDLSKYGIKNLNVGEEKIISTAKNGLKSNGYLEYYDKNGVLIKTKKIRENIYNPTKTVVVRKEN